MILFLVNIDRLRDKKERNVRTLDSIRFDSNDKWKRFDVWIFIGDQSTIACDETSFFRNRVCVKEEWRTEEECGKREVNKKEGTRSGNSGNNVTNYGKGKTCWRIAWSEE